MTGRFGDTAGVSTGGRHDEPSVDLTALDALRAIEASRLGFVARVIALFLEQAAQRIAEMKAAATTADRERFERAAHTLKSSAATVGAFRLSALCRECPGALRAGAAPGGLVEPIASEYDRVAAILTGILVQGEASHAPR